MKIKGIIGALSLLLIGIIFGAILVSGFGFVRPSLADLKLGATEPPVKLDADASSFSQAFIEVAEKVLNDCSDWRCSEEKIHIKIGFSFHSRICLMSKEVLAAELLFQRMATSSQTTMLLKMQAR
jgi:hypothetical protein